MENMLSGAIILKRLAKLTDLLETKGRPGRLDGIEFPTTTFVTGLPAI